MSALSELVNIKSSSRVIDIIDIHAESHLGVPQNPKTTVTLCSNEEVKSRGADTGTPYTADTDSRQTVVQQRQKKKRWSEVV